MFIYKKHHRDHQKKLTSSEVDKYRIIYIQSHYEQKTHFCFVSETGSCYEPQASVILVTNSHGVQ